MGGTLDPKTGHIVWEMDVPVEQQVAHYSAHPPRCLEGMTCTPIELPDYPFDGHGEPVNVIFELACSCGSKLFAALGHREGDELVAPIHLECDGCATTRVIFDPRKHGHDGALGDATWDVSDAIEELGMSDVDLPHPVVVRFEYPSDVLGDDEWKGREEDLFSWITLLARDGPNGQLVQLFESECA